VCTCSDNGRPQLKTDNGFGKVCCLWQEPNFLMLGAHWLRNWRKVSAGVMPTGFHPPASHSPSSTRTTIKNLPECACENPHAEFSCTHAWHHKDWPNSVARTPATCKCIVQPHFSALRPANCWLSKCVCVHFSTSCSPGTHQVHKSHCGGCRKNK